MRRRKVTPYHYFRYIQDDQWAFGIMGDGSQSKQVIVGAVVLESYYVVFDRQVVVV